MTITLHELAVETFVPMLGTLTHLLDKAAAHAAARNIDVIHVGRYIRRRDAART